jgi:hypothetical protein
LAVTARSIGCAGRVLIRPLALPETTDNGRWLIATKDAPVTINRRYRPGTLILETEFKTDTGCAVIIIVADD